MTVLALGRLAAMLVGAAALAMSAAVAAKTPSKRQTGVWEVVQGEFADRQTCMAIGAADQSTFLMLKLDTSHMADHVIALLFSNIAWSIKQGDELGELEFHAGDTIAGGEVIAADRGFFFYMSLEPAEVWFEKTRASGFWIERDGKEIGRFKGGNLAETFRKIRACGEKLIKADPFAIPVKPKSALNAVPSAPEAAVTPPKPIGLYPWIGAIQKDYFAGLLGGNDVSLRRDRRNSTPAALRFKMTVDASGKMTNCEVIASSGLQEWSQEFCSLAARHPLAFSPALSAAGQPVRGEYITSAVVAFE